MIVPGMTSSSLLEHGRGSLTTSLVVLSGLFILNGVRAGSLGYDPPYSEETADHLPIYTDTGYQVLLPDFEFTSHGRISSLSALLAYTPSPSDFRYGVKVQVWRPMSGGKYYQLVVYAEIGEFKNDTLYHRHFTEETLSLYFKPGDILGFFVRKNSGSARPFYTTYRDVAEGETGMDMYFINSTKQRCQMSTRENLEENIMVIHSVIPNIQVNFETNSPVFASETFPTDCEEITALLALPQSPTPSITTSASSTTPSSDPVTVPSGPLLTEPQATSSSALPLTDPPATPSPAIPTTEPSVEPTASTALLPIIATGAGGGLVIMILGGIFIVIVALICKKRKTVKESPRQANNALYRGVEIYSDVNRVDDPSPYASTLRLKPGTYLDIERGPAANGSTPHFSLRTRDGSAASLLSSHTQTPHGAIQRILTPPGQAGAVSMQLPRAYELEVPSGGGRVPGSSLREVSNHRPPIPAEMQDSRNHRNCRRVSAPGKARINSHQMLSAVNSMPALRAQSLSPSPCPPTPQISDTPGPYLTPEKKPWYSSDNDVVDSPVKIVLPEEEELYVPTMEERNIVGEDYSRLVQPHHSKQVQPDCFSEPASSTGEIYQQLSSWKVREVIRQYITVCDQIGSGHFATVHRGVWQRPGGELEVAVKELKSGTEEGDRVKFLQEAAIMGQFRHPNVVTLHGMVTIGEPIMIVMELMPNGDLYNYLSTFTDHSPSSTPPPSPRTPPIIPPSLPAQLLSFCRQVADGIHYLSRKNFVHRDLATRNIFLTKDFTCKIGDFGLARDLGEGDLYQCRGGKIPIKWTAPEALQYREYTSASDVWSYGMVLFEIWSLGHRPYDVYTEERDVMELIEGSVCQPPPPGCPRELYQLMIHCWHSIPSDRPSFTSVCEFLNQSDSVLLRLPEDLPQGVSTRALELGAALSEARGLYLELQHCYEESVV